MLRKYVHNLPFVLCFVLCCAIVVLFNGSADSGRAWNGYYTVAVPKEDYNSSTAETYFTGFEYIASFNTELRYNDFGTFRTVTPDELEQRFVEGDPRVDEYMRNAAYYFRAEDRDGSEYRLFYIKSDKPFQSFYIDPVLTGNFPETWSFPDFNIAGRIASGFLFLLIWAFGIWMLREIRLLSVFTGVPWFLLVTAAGSGYLSAACIVYISQLIAIKEIYPEVIFYLNYRETRIKASAYPALLTYGAALIASSAALGLVFHLSVFPAAAAIVGDLLLIFVYYSTKSERVRRQEHRIFFPIKMVDTGYEARSRKLPVYAAALAVSLIMPFFTLFIPSGTGLNMPLPDSAAAESGYSFSELKTVFDSRKAGTLTGAADLIAHEAYQEGFMYGMEYHFPQLDEQLVIRRYHQENNEIQKVNDAVLQFTLDWYTSIIDANKETGLAALLISQSSSANAVMGYIAADQKNLQILLKFLIISVVIYLPVLSLFIPGVSISLKRKGQEA